MNQPNIDVTFDGMLKGGVFVLGLLFAAYCILNALFGEWWALFIARLVVSISIVAIIAVGAVGVWQKIRSHKYMTDARISRAMAASQFAVIQDAKGTQQIVYDAKNNQWKQFFKPGSASVYDRMVENNGANPHDNQVQAQESQALEPLLPVLSPLSRLLVIGGMGTGKSELLRHLAADRVGRGHCIICDSHASPDTWPLNCQVAGVGRNYPEIEATINYVCNELDNRYKQRSEGVKRFNTITLIIDELFVLHQFLDLGAQFKSLLAESRKVQIELIMAGQSDRANALGLSGNKDLMAGFEAVVYLDRDDAGRYVAEVKGGKRNRDCLHPGPYYGELGNGDGGGHTHTHGKHGFNAKKGSSGPCVYVDMVDIDAEERDAEIIEQYRNGKSVSAIMKNVFGHRGGAQSDQIKGVLRRYDILV